MGKASTAHQNRLLNAADVTVDGKEFGNNRTFAELCLIPPCDCVYTAPLADAGWSSLAARRAHNPKVGGSNPPPATNFPSYIQTLTVDRDGMPVTSESSVREFCGSRPRKLVHHHYPYVSRFRRLHLTDIPVGVAFGRG
jgi:hypothetical protein